MNDNFKLGTDYMDFTVLRNMIIKQQRNPCNPCLKKEAIKIKEL